MTQFEKERFIWAKIHEGYSKKQALQECNKQARLVKLGIVDKTQFLNIRIH